MKKDLLEEKRGYFLHGGDYNPGQWENMPQIIDDDMHLMKISGCNTMTLGVFSWSEIEPSEGVYDFDFMDRMMDRLYQNGVRVILATPSGARPAWMSKSHPEVLRVREDGQRNFHGERHNHCITSEYYRKKTREINALLAKRYKNHPALIMWHISNEYIGECFCSKCQQAFREWLKEKYKTLDDLNDCWCTRFWSHTYTDWEQVEAPSQYGEKSINGLKLDWKRFVSYQTASFLENELIPIREITPNIPVTTNMLEPQYGLDYRVLKDYVDIISWDNYPDWHYGDDVEVAARTAFFHDVYRGLKKKPFLMMESTPSLTNWKKYNKLKKPGMHILSSLQAVAHGSDSVLYFQWRKSRGGFEKLHGAVVDHSGRSDTRVFREVSELGKILKDIGEIAGTQTVSEIAVVFDWDNWWALDGTQGYNNENKDFIETVLMHYRALWRQGINVDVISASDDFSKYKIVIAPMLYMVSKKQISNIERYVRNGGVFVGTYITGIADENDLCYLGGTPAGVLKGVFGLRSEETDTLMPGEFNILKFNNKQYKIVKYCDIVYSETAKALGYYERDFYAGQPALLKNEYEKGVAYYIAFCDTGDFCNDFYGELIKQKGIKRNINCELSEGVTVQSRTDGENEYIFIQNYTPEPVYIELEKSIQLPDESLIEGKTKIQGYGVKIIKKFPE